VALMRRVSVWRPAPTWWRAHAWVEHDDGQMIARRLVCLGRGCPRHPAGLVVEEVFLDRETRRVIGLGKAGERE
jgi:hypothetical protein